MKLSVIVRNKNDDNIFRCVSSFSNVPRDMYELIVIDSSDSPLVFPDFDISLRYEYTNISRSEALIIGLKKAIYENILIIDSDQVITTNLIEKLSEIQSDMCIINERSLNRNFIGTIADLQRDFLYKHSKQYWSDKLPVIPRLYRKSLISKAIERIGMDQYRKITQHEDSILYSEVLKISKDLSFCDMPILNIDPRFKDFAVKSFKYGMLQARALSDENIDMDRKKLLRSIDRNRVIYSKSQGLNKGIIFDVLKAAFYIPGIIFSKVSRL